MNALIERLGLAALRRLCPRASDSFAQHALYIVSRPLADREFDRLAGGAPSVAVRSGPFAGLKMLRHSSGTGHLTKILGTYETQLAPWVERIIAQAPSVVINIGCGDGYYLSGMAIRLPAAKCIGFDSSADCVREAIETAELNGLAARVTIHGLCTSESFNAALVENVCVIVDCEGGELALLDPAKSPRLVTATMLVELHDFIVPGITPALCSRFAATHSIEMIGQAVTLPPALAKRPEIVQLALVCEHRGEAQEWMLLTPR